MIQISRSGLRIIATDAELDALASTFAATHLLRLPHFFDTELGDVIDRRLSRAAFTPRRDGELVIEHTLADEDLFAVCLFVLNDPDVFALIDRLTQSGPFASFTGRIYRRGEPTRPGEQYYEWHDDVHEDRRVALSINLGRQKYAGGMLQIREAGTARPLIEASNVDYLEALLVRIDPHLEHRVAPVVGPTPRTVLAGWFRGGDPVDLS